MKYVQPIGGSANDPYVDANPSGGIEGSPVPAAAIEHPMRELAALISDAGLTPTEADLTQVAKAIKTIFQKAASISAAASGTVDAITANYTPAIAALADHMLLIVRASGANTSTTPTFTPASATITAKTIVKGHNQALVAGDISGAGFRMELQYDLTLDKWVLLNPATGVSASQTPPQFDNSTKNATTEFVQRALGNRSGDGFHTVSGNIHASEVGKTIVASSASALLLSLPSLASVPSGAELEIINYNLGLVTIQRTGADVISSGGNGLTTMTLAFGCSLRLINSNSAWTVLNDDAGLVNSPLFGASFSGNGYQKLPSGLILQWGRVANASRQVDGTALGPISYPIAFPNAVLSVNAQMVGGEAVSLGSLDGFLFVKTVGLTSFNLISGFSATTTFDFGAYWFAIGY